MSKAFPNETEHAINGVVGRMFARGVQNAKLGTFSTQTWKASREYQDNGHKMRCIVLMRFDDQCKNRHNTFAITCDIDEWTGSRFRDYGGGAAHDTIAQVFPELAPFIKWHLCSSDEPMHYISNTLYHAGDRDCWGLRKGETRQIRNGKTNQLAWILDDTPTKYLDADQKPPSVTLEYRPWLHIGEGKDREFNYARSTAIWPEATDEQLSAEPDVLKAVLLERHPQLMQDFRAAMESAGFQWSAKEG